MESSSQDEEVICADLVQTALVEGSVIHQTTGLVDYYESKDSPIRRKA